MQASERERALPRAVPTATTAGPTGTGTSGVAGVPMRDLLASCAAASAVSTPPRAPAVTPPAGETRRHPEAA
ncbi:hypothetical protein [Streptomyces sp. CRN 30]|uniref:hypothetical protein n=1 Tax=Streptomyces sp. CRN 30 TaxID=3075613 RepID=UPI002A8206FD|nr:hypothetical protein [Streptomyces sp. CRN 30]